jgi:hypothetical protein
MAFWASHFVRGIQLQNAGRGALARMIVPILAAHPEMRAGVEILRQEMEAIPFDLAARTAAEARCVAPSPRPRD